MTQASCLPIGPTRCGEPGEPAGKMPFSRSTPRQDFLELRGSPLNFWRLLACLAVHSYRRVHVAAKQKRTKFASHHASYCSLATTCRVDRFTSTLSLTF